MKAVRKVRRQLLTAALVAPFVGIGVSASAQSGGEVTISHYFSGEFGKKALDEIIGVFQDKTGYMMKDSPVGHEDFKTDILVRAAGQSLPDVFSYWAGARVQFVVDSGSLTSIDDMWASEGLDDIVAKSVADSATLYDGVRYLVPMNYPLRGNVLQHEGARRRGRHGHALRLGRIPGAMRYAQRERRDSDRAGLDEPLAGPILVRLLDPPHGRP